MKRSFVVAMAAITLAMAACGRPTTAPPGGLTTATWDLVALGDSMATGYGVGLDEVYTQQYAALLEDELDITVTVRSHATNELTTVAEWVEVVATDESLRTDLREAEIVTLWLGFHDIGEAVFGGCTGDWPDPLKACFEEATASMPSDFDELLASIKDLVPEEATVLMADIGIPPAVLDQWSGKPFWPQMKHLLFDRMRDSVHVAAGANGVTVVHSYEALVGPNGEVPYPQFLQSDRIHLNAEGHRFVAELHAAQDGLGNE